MTPTLFFTTLLLAAGAWHGAHLYQRAAESAARAATEMTARTTPQRPAIDLEAPAEFRTATFALG
ncbi:MAG: hypothetical protein ACON4Z_04870 [Planctomycetota bacterium]